MSWRGKRKDEEDHASDGDSEGHAPPKKTCKRDSADDNSDEIIACEVTISLFLLLLVLSARICEELILGFLGNCRSPRIGG